MQQVKIQFSQSFLADKVSEPKFFIGQRVKLVENPDCEFDLVVTGVELHYTTYRRSPEMLVGDPTWYYKVGRINHCYSSDWQYYDYELEPV
jgi:hypothetical protein